MRWILRNVARWLFLRFLARHGRKIVPLIAERTRLGNSRFRFILRLLDQYFKRFR